VTWAINEKGYSQRHACALIGIHHMPPRFIAPRLFAPRAYPNRMCVGWWLAWHLGVSAVLSPSFGPDGGMR
jgi:hypothetical protein